MSCVPWPAELLRDAEMVGTFQGRARSGGCNVRVDHDHRVSVDQGAARDCRHLVDGRHALSAAAVRLSLRSRGRIEAVRDLQGDGMAIAEGDHQPGNDRHLAGRALSGLERALVRIRLVSRQTDAGAHPVGRPRLFFAAGQGFWCGPEYQKPEILSYYQ